MKIFFALKEEGNECLLLSARGQEGSSLLPPSRSISVLLRKEEKGCIFPLKQGLEGRSPFFSKEKKISSSSKEEETSSSSKEEEEEREMEIFLQGE